MKKQAKTTTEQFFDSLTAKERKQFEQEHKELLLSELLLAAMQEDEISVRELAKLAGVSATVVQAMRSDDKKDFSLKVFFKVLKGLGCKKLMVERKGQYIAVDISSSIKK